MKKTEMKSKSGFKLIQNNNIDLQIFSVVNSLRKKNVRTINKLQTSKILSLRNKIHLSTMSKNSVWKTVFYII
jgi:hypothetical protein